MVLLCFVALFNLRDFSLSRNTERALERTRFLTILTLFRNQHVTRFNGVRNLKFAVVVNTRHVIFYSMCTCTHVNFHFSDTAT